MNLKLYIAPAIVCMLLIFSPLTAKFEEPEENESSEVAEKTKEDAAAETTEVIGRITFIKGEVDLISLKDGSRVKAVKGNAITISHEIRTSIRSFCRVILIDNVKIEIGAFSIVNIRPLFGALDADAEANIDIPMSVRMLAGKIRINMPSGQYSSKKKFILKTPTMIAGVKGTHFAAIATVDDARLVVFEGRVQVANRSPTIRTSYVLKKRQEIRIREGLEPERPQFVPDDLLENYLDNYEITKQQKIRRRIREPNTIIDKMLRNVRR